MDNKKCALSRAFKFMGEKGFYIVLFICAAGLGLTAWLARERVEGLGLAAQTELSAEKAPERAVLPLEREAIAPTAPETAPPVQNLPRTEPVAVMEPVAEQPKPTPAPEPEAAPDAEDKTAAAINAEAKAPQFIWPVAGAVERAHSLEALCYDRTMRDWRTHRGVDIAASLGAKVMAAADGTVELVYSDHMYGSTVVVRHGGGLVSLYANLAAVPAVAEGDHVAMGDTIGSVGETAIAEIGEVTHLHFEMTRDGSPVDPADYLPEP